MLIIYLSILLVFYYYYYPIDIALANQLSMLFSYAYVASLPLYSEFVR